MIGSENHELTGPRNRYFVSLIVKLTLTVAQSYFEHLDDLAAGGLEVGDLVAQRERQLEGLHRPRHVLAREAPVQDRHRACAQMNSSRYHITGSTGETSHGAQVKV